MPPDLQSTFVALARRIPRSEARTIELSARNVPRAPARLAATQLMIQRTAHQYDSSTLYAGISISGTKPVFRSLALLCLSVVFNERPREVRVEIAHEGSDVKRLIVTNKWIYETQRDYVTRPLACHYTPGPAHRHPWSKDRDAPAPWAELTQRDGFAGGFSREEFDTRDTVRGFGSDAGMVAFAKLLLNFSQRSSKEDEIALERENGFRGVAMGSAEISLWLPGAIGCLL